MNVKNLHVSLGRSRPKPVRLLPGSAISYPKMPHESRVTAHMVSSLDGFIAAKDNDISWLSSSDTYDEGAVLTEEQASQFISAIDCYVMGSRTYEHALQLGWPYGDKPVFVLTSRGLKTDKGNVEFCSGDLYNLVNGRLRRDYKNIWLVGGAAVVGDFLRHRLVDEIVMSIMPVILGEGLLFYDCIRQEQRLHLKNVTAYRDGMVELWYEIIHEHEK